jgi:phosphoglucomutase
MAFDITTQSNINTWLNGNYDAESKAEIKRLQDAGEEEALTNAFYKDLEFGTGGLRGIMGVGSNRVNRYTLGAATQGFANYLNKTFDGDIRVVLAHDCRNNSTLFANLVADVFSANGITVFFFDGMRPTPELSFAVRKLGAKGGVMLTASHNPKEYNGYKAYGPDGGQLVSPDDTGVMSEVRNIKSIDEIKFERNADLVKSIGAGIDEDYYNELVKLSLNPEAIAKVADMPIVFSPIHGTGAVSVPPILKRFGFTNVITVEEQMVEDGNFPTVVYPNPEEQEALTMALNKAREVNADLVMATDPDADRVGIAIRNGEGELVLLNGNQTACLLVHYVLSGHQQKKDLRKSDYVVKTVVTSYMIDHIAKSFGVECFNTLTGFKFIGQVMTKLEGDRRFLVGGEESYGYLAGEHARDKDAVISCALIAEMAAYHKSQGRSLWDVLIDLYEEYGFYLEKLIAVKKEGKAGAEEIQAMMSRFRENPPSALGGGEIVMIKDYQESVSTSFPSGKTELIDLPSSNVLQFFTEDGTIVSARPSGTEPKIKFYCSVNAGLSEAADFERTQKALEAKIDRVLADLGV